MNVLFNLIAFFLVISTSSFAQFNHRYIVGGTGSKEVKIINKDGTVEWSYPCQGKCSDVWQLSNGNVIFADQYYAKEVTLEKITVWEFKAPRGTEIQTISPIGNEYLIAINGTPSKIVELSKKGHILKTIEFDTGIEKPHAQFRQVRKTPWGTYLAGTMQTSKIIEVDNKGKIIREIPITGQAFVGIPLPNKNILIACGEGHYLQEVNPQNEVVWEVKDEDIPEIPLRFVAGLQRLPNGNTVICNWGGHGHRGEQAQIIEITRDKKVVGKVFNYEMVNEPAAIHILNIEGQPEKAVKFLEDGTRILTGIPVVRNFQAFNQVSKKNTYQYGFSMVFKNQKDYTTYNDHPDHVAFVQERWIKEVTDFLEIDFKK